MYSLQNTHNYYVRRQNVYQIEESEYNDDITVKPETQPVRTSIREL